MEEDVTAPAAGLLQRSADGNQERSILDSAAASDSDPKSEEPENDEVLVNEGEELEEVDESGGCCGTVGVWHCELNFIERY